MMQDAFCLTALEAAEMLGIELNEMMRIAASDAAVAIKVGDAWRVDPSALTRVMNDGSLLQAA